MSTQITCPACRHGVTLTPSQQVPTHVPDLAASVLCRASGWCVPTLEPQEIVRAYRYYLGVEQ